MPDFLATIDPYIKILEFGILVFVAWAFMDGRIISTKTLERMLKSQKDSNTVIGDRILEGIEKIVAHAVEKAIVAANGHDKKKTTSRKRKKK